LQVVMLMLSALQLKTQKKTSTTHLRNLTCG
jgi:hypothetical protein